MNTATFLCLIFLWKPLYTAISKFGVSKIKTNTFIQKGCNKLIKSEDIHNVRKDYYLK